MTIEDPHQLVESPYIVNSPILPENNKDKCCISALILITIIMNLSIYNIWLIPGYNNEVQCILESNIKCVNESFPCYVPYLNDPYNPGLVIYYNVDDLDLGKVHVTLIMGVSIGSLCILGLMAISRLWNKTRVNYNYINICASFSVMAILLILNFVMYRVIDVLAEKVLLYQEYGCYTLTNADLFSYVINYNEFNMLCAGLGVFIILMCICLVRLTYKRNSQMNTTFP